MSAPMTKEVGPVSAFGNFLEKLKPQLELALPAHMNANRMARLALTAFSTSTKLQQCEPRTIAASLMVAGQLGLEPGVNGQGWLIPYKKTCTFVPGWKGLVDLVNRAGRATVYTGVIFKDQKYVFTDGARRDLVVHDETELLAPEDSVEDQAAADERIPLLLQTPAATRWISAEPLLGPIRLDMPNPIPSRYDEQGRGIDWVVVGGESGASARPMVLGWAKDIVRQCQEAGVPVLMKQVGANPTNREGEPHKISDRKGAIMEEWPEVLRVREYPEARP